MVDRKVAGLKNKVNGAFFEDIINQACDFYRVRGVADIEKTPEPVRLIKPIKGKPGYFVAVHNEAAQVDYKGFLRGGQAVEFEAKFRFVKNKASSKRLPYVVSPPTPFPP